MKDSGGESVNLVDPDLMSVKEKEKKTLKYPEKFKEKQKSKKLTPSKYLFEKDLKDLDAKWSERLSRIEALLVARSLEKPADPIFQAVTVTPIEKPPAGTVDTIGPYLPLTTATDQTGTDQAPVQHKQVPSTSTAMLPHSLN